MYFYFNYCNIPLSPPPIPSKNSKATICFVKYKINLVASWGKLVEIIIIKITTVIAATVKIIASTNNNNEVTKQKKLLNQFENIDYL